MKLPSVLIAPQRLRGVCQHLMSCIVDDKTPINGLTMHKTVMYFDYIVKMNLAGIELLGVTKKGEFYIVHLFQVFSTSLFLPLDISRKPRDIMDIEGFERYFTHTACVRKCPYLHITCSLIKPLL